MSYTVSLFHIVFGTKCRRPSIDQQHKHALRNYILGIAQNKRCDIIAMNAMPDHVHILLNLHPKVALADFVGSVKQSTSLWMKTTGLFPLFDNWSKEYYAVSLSPDRRGSVGNYIKNQETHHNMKTFAVEIEQMVEDLGFKLYPDSFDK